jgi:hypothetical protein
MSVDDRVMDLSADLDEALVALTNLLADVNVATLEDPSKHRVANTVALGALVARQILERHGRLEALSRAVQERHGAAE